MQDPVLQKHLLAVRAIANESKLNHSNNEEILLLIRDVHTFQFPMKAHTQSIEQGVNWISELLYSQSEIRVIC